MIEIKVPKEITEYKEKFLFGLTVRQTLSLAAALAVCVPLYIFGKDYIGEDLIAWLVLLIAAPLLAFGFLQFNGLPSEQFLLMLIRQMWIEPQKRKYIEQPVFWLCREEIIDEEIAHQTEEKKKNVRKVANNNNGTISDEKY